MAFLYYLWKILICCIRKTLFLLSASKISFIHLSFFFFFFLYCFMYYWVNFHLNSWNKLSIWILLFNLNYAIGEDVPPMQLKEGVFRCILQLYDCLLTEVHEKSKKGLSLAKRLNSSLAFFCYDLLSIIEPRQVFELVCVVVFKNTWNLLVFVLFFIYCFCNMIFMLTSFGVKINLTRVWI